MYNPIKTNINKDLKKKRQVHNKTTFHNHSIQLLSTDIKPHNRDYS